MSVDRGRMERKEMQDAFVLNRYITVWKAQSIRVSLPCSLIPGFLHHHVPLKSALGSSRISVTGKHSNSLDPPLISYRISSFLKDSKKE